MKKSLRALAAVVFLVTPAIAFAQADPHHPETGSAGAAPAAPAAPALREAGDQPANMQMMQSMQMMQMMQMMMQMMPMMQQMMGMMQGGMPQTGMAQGMQSGGMANMPMAGAMSDANKAYMAAMAMMNVPMMMAAQSADPDVAFVKAMIPHHQAAIAMAKAVLQYGKDDKVKELANQVIKAQEAEVTQMEGWLKQRGQ